MISEHEITTLLNDSEKAQKVKDLLISWHEIDAAIEPYKEQKKELRELFVKETGVLTNEQFSMLKKAYTAAKNSKFTGDAFGTLLDETIKTMKKEGIIDK